MMISNVRAFLINFVNLPESDNPLATLPEDLIVSEALISYNGLGQGDPPRRSWQFSIPE